MSIGGIIHNCHYGVIHLILYLKGPEFVSILLTHASLLFAKRQTTTAVHSQSLTLLPPSRVLYPNSCCLFCLLDSLSSDACIAFRKSSSSSPSPVRSTGVFRFFDAAKGCRMSTKRNSCHHDQSSTLTSLSSGCRNCIRKSIIGVTYITIHLRGLWHWPNRSR